MLKTLVLQSCFIGDNYEYWISFELYIPMYGCAMK